MMFFNQLSTLRTKSANIPSYRPKQGKIDHHRTPVVLSTKITVYPRAWVQTPPNLGGPDGLGPGPEEEDEEEDPDPETLREVNDSFEPWEPFKRLQEFLSPKRLKKRFFEVFDVANEVKRRHPPSFYLIRWEWSHRADQNAFKAFHKRKYFSLARQFQRMYMRNQAREERGLERSPTSSERAWLKKFWRWRRKGHDHRYVVPPYIDEFIQFPEFIPWYWHLHPSRRRILYKWCVREFMKFNKSRMDVIKDKFIEGFASQMTQAEALNILGNPVDTPDGVSKAHRKLMLLNHPDNGGSTYIATKINEAKEFLLRANEGKTAPEEKKEESKPTADGQQRSGPKAEPIPPYLARHFLGLEDFKLQRQRWWEFDREQELQEQKQELRQQAANP